MMSSSYRLKMMVSQCAGLQCAAPFIGGYMRFGTLDCRPSWFVLD
jgi:hypothetical protein